jgi:polysaccharide biosynthesis transport protein
MEEKSLLYYWLALYRKKMEVFMIILISVLTTVILSVKLKPVYEARVVFYIPSSSPATSYMSNNSTDQLKRNLLIPAANEELYSPYMGILKSKSLAQMVQKDFSEKDLSKLLRFDIDIELTDEFMITVYSRDRDPGIASGIANAYAKYFNMMLQDISLKNLKVDQSLIEAQLSDVQKMMIDASIALKTYEEKNSIASLDEELRQFTMLRAKFQGELDAIEVRIKDLDDRTASFAEQIKKEKKIYAGKDFSFSSLVIDQLQLRLSDLSAQINAATVELTDSHPDVLSLKRRYDDVSSQLKDEIQRLVSSQIKPENTLYEKLRQNLVLALVDRSGLYAQKIGYIHTIDKISNRLKALPAMKMEWQRLNDNVRRYQTLYERLHTDLSEAQMQQARDIQFISVVDVATPPEAPVFPKLWLNIVVAFMCSLIVGIFYAFFIDFIQETRRVRTRKIIKRILAE